MTIIETVSYDTNSVGIIGCGWLGTQLAKSLIKQGVDVFVTTRKEESQQQIMAQGINCKLLNLNFEATDFDEETETGKI
jgi:Trk K+ transport system NAD-binding subunit